MTHDATNGLYNLWLAGTSDAHRTNDNDNQSNDTPFTGLAETYEMQGETRLRSSAGWRSSPRVIISGYKPFTATDAPEDVLISYIDGWTLEAALLETVVDTLKAALPSTSSSKPVANVASRDIAIGTLGVLHPTVLGKFELGRPCSSFEIDVEPLL